MNLKFFLLFLMLVASVVVNSAEVDVHCCIIGKLEDSTIEYPLDEHRITSMMDEANLISDRWQCVFASEVTRWLQIMLFRL